MKYRICWTAIVTGYTQKGEAVLDKDEAEQIVDDLNREWPNLLHWAEPGDEVTQ